MRIRDKKTKREGITTSFNIHGVSEVIVYWQDGDKTSEFISNLEIWLGYREIWKDMFQAFKDDDLWIDDSNTYFFENPHDVGKNA